MPKYMRKIATALTFLGFALFAPISLNAQLSTGFVGAGEYGEFLDDLHTMMITNPNHKKVMLGGKERLQFLPWARDHVHVLKAMKYWEEDVSGIVEFFLENQTASGMFFDYYMPVESHQNHRISLFERKYWEILSGEGIQFHRLPVEADVEYLLVEGVYYIWQSTGDTAFLRKWLPALEKGIMYSMNDPDRWSTKHQLIKRPYTLDTWDFQDLPVHKSKLKDWGGDEEDMIFNIFDDTPMGIMHGDNSGLYAACRQLALFHSFLGNETDAKVWNHYAEIIRLRTNQVCWNGRFYKHFAIEDAPRDYNTMDQENTLGISNPYSVNRGIATEEMAQSVVQTYLDLREETREESVAEWFGIYPAVEPFFGTVDAGTYMNGGLVTIVAGELAKAALQHGYEAYGIDIFNRLMEITESFNGNLPCVVLPDGTEGGGIPGNWGQAAVASALIEGLAGVEDMGVGFAHVRLSPRWSYTSQKKLEVNVAYGPSNKSIAYKYRSQKDEILMEVSGEASCIDCRVLLPKGVETASAFLNGKAADSRIESIRDSHYLVIEGIQDRNPKLSVKW